MSPERSAVLGTLLASTSPSTYNFHDLLQPIWANETMHRAYATVFLVKGLEELLPVAYLCPSVVAAEITLANELSALLTTLNYSDAKAATSCSKVLRETVRHVVELFGPIDGRVTLETRIATMILPAFQSRALVLLALHLVVNALRYSLRAPEGGRIDVTLTRVDDRTAQLAVADSGKGFVGVLPSSCSVVHDLASLLEAVPEYSSPVVGGGTVVVKFANQFEAA
jgi:signal transduction histidine kinase